MSRKKTVLRKNPFLSFFSPSSKFFNQEMKKTTFQEFWYYQKKLFFFYFFFSFNDSFFEFVQSFLFFATEQMHKKKFIYKINVDETRWESIMKSHQKKLPLTLALPDLFRRLIFTSSSKSLILKKMNNLYQKTMLYLLWDLFHYFDYSMVTYFSPLIL